MFQMNRKVFLCKIFLTYKTAICFILNTKMKTIMMNIEYCELLFLSVSH